MYRYSTYHCVVLQTAGATGLIFLCRAIFVWYISIVSCWNICPGKDVECIIKLVIFIQCYKR
jgi:hypothetical protein